MMSRLLTLVILFITADLAAQDTLPRFTVTTRGNNKVIISWTNPYPVVTQISIQRSSDSAKNFRTILTVPDPTVPQNGFVDTRANNAFQYYRLFIVRENGDYVFSRSQRPFWDTAASHSSQNEPGLTGENNNRRVVVAESMPPREVEKLKEKLQEVIKKEEPKTTPVPPSGTVTPPTPKATPEKFFYVKRNNSIILQIPEKGFKKFRDSLVYKTKDTIAFKTLDTLVIKPFVPKEIYKPSRYVFTDRDGNVIISLADAPRKEYEVKFFEDDRTPLFDIKQIKEPMLIVDKVNFIHAGWFRFELFQDGKLQETHKLFIPKDF